MYNILIKLILDVIMVSLVKNLAFSAKDTAVRVLPALGVQAIGLISSAALDSPVGKIVKGTCFIGAGAFALAKRSRITQSVEPLEIPSSNRQKKKLERKLKAVPPTPSVKTTDKSAVAYGALSVAYGIYSLTSGILQLFEPEPALPIYSAADPNRPSTADDLPCRQLMLDAHQYAMTCPAAKELWNSIIDKVGEVLFTCRESEDGEYRALASLTTKEVSLVVTPLTPYLYQMMGSMQMMQFSDYVSSFADHICLWKSPKQYVKYGLDALDASLKKTREVFNQCIQGKYWFHSKPINPTLGPSNPDNFFTARYYKVVKTITASLIEREWVRQCARQLTLWVNPKHQKP